MCITLKKFKIPEKTVEDPRLCTRGYVQQLFQISCISILVRETCANTSKTRTDRVKNNVAFSTEVIS